MPMPNSDFIRFYNAIASSSTGSYIHPKDEEYLKSKDLFAKHDGVKKDAQFISDLVPEPFTGDIVNAKIFMILNNPGFGGNEWNEQNALPNSSSFKNMLLDSLNLKFDANYPFWPLNPAYADCEGAKWWKKKLGDLATPAFSKIFTPIEWTPYHSKKFNANAAKSLESYKIQRDFILNTLVPKAEAGEILLIVARDAFARLDSSHGALCSKGTFLPLKTIPTKNLILIVPKNYRQSLSFKDSSALGLGKAIKDIIKAKGW